MQPIHIIGGGLAGSEAAWQVASRGVPVVLHEMRPLRSTAVHKTGGLAELVCSNSFRSDDREHNAVGLLHEEMRRLDSLVMRAADANQVPAGGALAVDRDGFSQAVGAALEAQPLVRVSREEIAELPPAEWDSVIVATGPLTSPGLAAAIGAVAGMMAAPIVYLDPNMMGGILLYSFAGAVLGGIDNPWGAVLGGFVVGVLENLVGAYLVGAEVKLSVALVIIVGVLVVRPSGLFGRRIVARV